MGVAVASWGLAVGKAKCFACLILRQASDRNGLVACRRQDSGLMLHWRKQIGHEVSRLRYAADSCMQCCSVGGRLEESCEEGCHGIGSALRPELLGKPSAYLLALRFAFIPHHVGCFSQALQQSWSHAAQASSRLFRRGNLSGSHAVAYVCVWGIGGSGCK